jgi:hypothetical protein
VEIIQRGHRPGLLGRQGHSVVAVITRSTPATAADYGQTLTQGHRNPKSHRRYESYAERAHGMTEGDGNREPDQSRCHTEENHSRIGREIWPRVYGLPHNPDVIEHGASAITA